LLISKFVSFSPWAPDFPGENAGCGCLDQKGKLESATYEEAKFYVCERHLGAPAVCEEGWEHYGKSCYMVITFEVTERQNYL
jgi:hypothetical protein